MQAPFGMRINCHLAALEFKLPHIMITIPSSISSVEIVGPMPLKVPLPDNGLFIFVDGGQSHQKHRVGISVGDGDSHSGPCTIAFPTQKDFSDLKGTLDLLPPHLRQLNLHGYFGGRWDHQLAVLMDLHQWLRTQNQCVASISPSFNFYSAGDYAIDDHGPFGLVLLASAKVTLSGDCEYQIQAGQNLQELSSHGISNKAFGKILLKTSGPILWARGKMEDVL